MIYTLTLNPAIDYYISMEKFQLGGLNSLDDGYTLPGGKGINVSKVLKNFSVNSKALGFVGGFTGEYIIKHLEDYNIENDFIKLEENTRINIKLKIEKEETEIAGKSPNVSKEDIEKLLKNFYQIKDNDIVVLSGSVPNSIENSIYSKIIGILPEKTRVILDSRGSAFSFGMREGVYLTKPNKSELEELFNKKLESVEKVVEAGRELQSLGSENVLISLGKEGSILITKNNIYRGNAPQGKLISSVGAGDSMLAGLIYGLSLDLSLEESYKYAIASGSSTAFSEGLTTFEDMKELLDRVKIDVYEKISI